MALEFPTIYLLPKGLDTGSLSELESQIPSLTYDIKEAQVVLGKISQPVRAKWELRSRNVFTEDIAQPKKQLQPLDIIDLDDSCSGPPATKRRKVIGDIGYKKVTSDSNASITTTATPVVTDPSGTTNIVKVVKLSWFLDCLESNAVLPLDKYLVYQGIKVPSPPLLPPPPLPPTKVAASAAVWERVRNESQGQGHKQKPEGLRGLSQAPSSSQQHLRAPEHHAKRPVLVHESTSEHDRVAAMPPIPDFLHTTYSCQRPTPANSPNAAFIKQLKEIQTVRTLAGDKVGARAYSTAISTLAAYPHPLSCVPEIARLPGCSTKLAALWGEWRDTGGRIQEVEDAKADPKLRVLKLFYDIWGVAETTAREFYKKGWRDIDDVVEYGWDTLSRVQQIGVKFYDEFQLKIPRAEVEAIGRTILRYANKLHKNGGFQMVIVGGYRRGKRESGDVDVVLSHPDPARTLNFIEAIVDALDTSGYITHTLTLSTTNSERGQTPVAWKGEGGRLAGSGFDTLDKAMVVWQDPVSPSKDDKDNKSASQKNAHPNPNPHRRVDIIVSPWQTAGCAVLGWSGATTFERDLRRYCKHEKGWKFDSSGVRSRTDNGSWVDVESDLDGPAPDMLTAEKRVFRSLGLEWRPPEERCTDG